VQPQPPHVAFAFSPDLSEGHPITPEVNNFLSKFHPEVFVVEPVSEGVVSVSKDSTIHNIPGTATDPRKHSNGGWIGFWEQNTGLKTTVCSCFNAEICEKNGKDYPLIGGHVHINSESGQWYIINLCSHHNAIDKPGKDGFKCTEATKAVKIANAPAHLLAEFAAAQANGGAAPAPAAAPAPGLRAGNTPAGGALLLSSLPSFAAYVKSRQAAHNPNL